MQSLGQPQPRHAQATARQVRITLGDQDISVPPGAERITEVAAIKISRQNRPSA